MVDICDWNTNFFLWKLGGPFFLSQSLPTLRILHNKFGLIRTTSWPEKRPIFKITYLKKSQITVQKIYFFLGKLYKKLFLLFTFIKLVILYTKCGSLWTTLRPDKNSIFLKIEKSKCSIFAIEIRTFFLWKLGGPFFLSHSLPTLRILHAKFGLIWRTSWLDKKDLFLKYLFREFQKVPYEILTFFQGKLYQKIFLFYILITLVILHAEFGLIWTTPWPNKISIFLKI